MGAMQIMSKLIDAMERQGIWLSIDGTTIPIMDMDDKHLSNAHRIAVTGNREGYRVYVEKLRDEMQCRGLITSFKEMCDGRS
jgi:hypothetical protein